MANVVPFSFAQELLKGSHNFTSNTIKLALYTANPYTTASTTYTSGSANQVSGTGYTTGGNTLNNPVVANQTNHSTSPMGPSSVVISSNANQTVTTSAGSNIKYGVSRWKTSGAPPGGFTTMFEFRITM